MDAFKLAQLPRDKPLKTRDLTTGFTCIICGAKQEPFSWRVTLPGTGKQACPNCAADAGWTVR